MIMLPLTCSTLELYSFYLWTYPRLFYLKEVALVIDRKYSTTPFANVLLAIIMIYAFKIFAFTFDLTFCLAVNEVIYLNFPIPFTYFV